MKAGLLLGISVGLLSLIVIMPGIINADGPGIVYGTIGYSENPDIWFRTTQGTGLWSCVYSSADDQAGQWMRGMTITDLEFRDTHISPPKDEYNYYVKEMTIPWIKIDWANRGEVIYEFDDWGSTESNVTVYNNVYQFSEGNLDINPQTPTGITAQYVLDVNDDQSTDFRFDVWYDLHADGATYLGDITMKIAVMGFPVWNNVNYAIEGDHVDYIYFPFLFNSDVYYSASDTAYNRENDDWAQIDEEGEYSAPGGTPCASINNSDRSIIMTPGNDGQSSGYYYVLAYQAGGQYSLFPSDYDNDQGTVGTDIVLWYVAGFDIANNNPPNNWITVNFAGLRS